jgi:predicted Zn finger-like uncharacterized protein
MEVRCDKCQARYRVDDARIGPQGLTMRCGKCQNTFRVTRAAAPAPQMAQPAPRPAAAARAPDMNATAVFAVPPAARPSAPAKPAPQPAKAAAAISAAPPAPEEAGRTMMFPAANLPTAGVAASKGPRAGAVAFGHPAGAKVPAAPAKQPPPPAKPAKVPGPGAAMAFGPSHAPVQAPPPVPPSVSEPPAAGQSTVSGKRSTLVFGPPQPRAKGAPATAPIPIAAPVQTPVPTPEPPSAAPTEDGGAAAATEALEHTTTPDLVAAGASAAAEEAPPPAEGHEVADEELSPEPGTFDRAPPRGLIIGVAAGLALLLVIGAGLVAYRKLAPRAPPPAAIETLASAEADAEKDSLGSIASAETKARDALEVAGSRVRFPQATAALARIEIQWADALNDQASRIAEKNADDPRIAQLQTQAKAKVKSAFDLLSPALKANADSQDLQLAFADYYRAKRLPSSMNRYLKDVKDESRAALIQGLALAQEDDGAEKAVPRLKAALAANPQSARIHYRLAAAHLALKDEASARAELKETLRLSPQHERAQALLEQLGDAAERK